MLFRGASPFHPMQSLGAPQGHLGRRYSELWCCFQLSKWVGLDASIANIVRIKLSGKMISENNLRGSFSPSPSDHPTAPSMSCGNSAWKKDEGHSSSGKQWWAKAVRSYDLEKTLKAVLGRPSLPFEVEQPNGCRGCSENSALTTFQAALQADQERGTFHIEVPMAAQHPYF